MQKPNEAETPTIKVVLQHVEGSGSIWNKLTTIEEYHAWAKSVGFSSVEDFESKTRTKFDEIRDKWFIFVLDRVYPLIHSGSPVGRLFTEEVEISLTPKTTFDELPEHDKDAIVGHIYSMYEGALELEQLCEDYAERLRPSEIVEYLNGLRTMDAEAEDGEEVEELSTE